MSGVDDGADRAVLLFLRGNELKRNGNLNGAVSAYRAALTAQPMMAEAMLNLGNALRQLGDENEALTLYRRAIAARPDFADAHNALGAALMAGGDTRAAIASYGAALNARPDYAQAHNNLGNALANVGETAAALKHLREATRLAPQFAEAWNNLGHVTQDAGRLVEAEACFRRAVDVAPDLALAWNNLGGAILNTGRIGEAIACFRRAVDTDLTFSVAHSNLIFALDFSLDPLQNGGFIAHQAERRRWFDLHGRALRQTATPYRNNPDPDRRLRIGYVSADFHRHSASACFGPVIRHHDRSQVDAICYASGTVQDSVTESIRAAATSWHEIGNVPDEALAERIRADGIDILVDLSGHSAGNRLLTFARKPAPVQVTAWGHATSTGLETMDYLFADPVVLPTAQRRLFVEAVYDLPCFITFEAPDDAPAVEPRSSENNVSCTFGCLNKLAKVTDSVLALWAQILAAVPDSRLLLKDGALGDAAVRSLMLERAVRYGIAADRLTLRGRTPHHEHLQAYSEVDIALDPFPQNGGISTYEALWMGVPVVALLGRSIASRVAAAVLSATGLPEWIASDELGYVDIAIARARDVAGLRRSRGRLRDQVSGSAAGDPVRYTRAVEDAYRTIWRRWCRERTS